MWAGGLCLEECNIHSLYNSDSSVRMTMETVKEPSSWLSDLIIIDCSKDLIFCSGLASLWKKQGGGQGEEEEKKEGKKEMCWVG